MSRRHHGRPHHHAQGAASGPRRVTGVSPGANTGPDANAGGAGLSAAPAPRPQAPAQVHGLEPVAPLRLLPAVTPPPATTAPTYLGPTDAPAASAPAPAMAPGYLNAGPDRNGQCTAPQLRRFIKSRPYVPMHELRRRFGINGGDDDVTPVRLEPGWIYVGLPSREGMLLGELLRAGEIGYELSLDPRSPIVIGVYPMRPISRG